MGVKRLALCLALAALSSLAMTTPASAQSLFVLGGTAREDVDPDDGQVPVNKVVSINNVGPGPGISGSITRNYGVNTSIKVKDLDNMLQVKYRFQDPSHGAAVFPKTCGDGSPRFELRIDVDGGGPQPPGIARGSLGEGTSTCMLGGWGFEDMTNASPKWDLSAFGVPPGPLTWDQMEAFFQMTHPGHGVHAVSLVEDQSFEFGLAGCSWYDNLTVKQNTLDGHEDTAGVGGKCQPVFVEE